MSGQKQGGVTITLLILIISARLRFNLRQWSEVHLHASTQLSPWRWQHACVWAYNWSTAWGNGHTSNFLDSLLNIFLFSAKLYPYSLFLPLYSWSFSVTSHVVISPPSVRHNVTQPFLIKLSECKITHQIGFMSNMPKSLEYTHSHTHTHGHYLSEHRSLAQSVYTCEAWP